MSSLEPVAIMRLLVFIEQVHPEGKFVVDIDKHIEIGQVTPNCRVALRNDSYVLHKILPNKVAFVDVFLPPTFNFVLL